MELTELQRGLAASLAEGAAAPAGIDERALGRMRRGLVGKRRRAAAELLPRLARALGEEWAPLFEEHARSYRPAGLLFHVDDAWAFAASLRRSAAPQAAAAAHDDLLRLRLRWSRHPGSEARRIRERRSPIVGITRLAPRTLILRLPGKGGRRWELRL